MWQGQVSRSFPATIDGNIQLSSSAFLQLDQLAKTLNLLFNAATLCLRNLRGFWSLQKPFSGGLTISIPKLFNGTLEKLGEWQVIFTKCCHRQNLTRMWINTTKFHISKPLSRLHVRGWARTHCLARHYILARLLGSKYMKPTLACKNCNEQFSTGAELTGGQKRSIK